MLFCGSQSFLFDDYAFRQAEAGMTRGLPKTPHPYPVVQTATAPLQPAPAVSAIIRNIR
jgi:hypothetical protein